MRAKFPKLPKRLKAKWVKALLSGKYKQTTGELCGEIYETPDKPQLGYCCLGVLGSVCGIPNKKMMFRGNLSDIDREDIIGPDGDDSLQRKMTYMNDNQGRSFKYIASYIERYL